MTEEDVDERMETNLNEPSSGDEGSDLGLEDEEEKVSDRISHDGSSSGNVIVVPCDGEDIPPNVI